MTATSPRIAWSIYDPIFELERTGLNSRREYRIKGNLRELARAILVEFPRILREASGELENPAPSALIAQYNLASLAQLQAGSHARALALCGKAISLCLQLTRESGTNRWLGEVFQPYINIGRIAAARGETENALTIFRHVFRFVTSREDFEVQGYRLDSAALAPPPGQNARLEPLFEVYLLDSIKALAWAGRFGRILLFVEETERLPMFDTPHFRRIAIEARARALHALGRYDDAARTMQELFRCLGTEALPQPAVCVFLAENCARCSDFGGAKDVLRCTEEHYPQLCTEDIPLSERRKFRYLVAVEFYRISEFAKAAEHAAQALKMNRELGDEPGFIRCAILLLRCATSGEETRLRFEMLRSAAEETWYVQEKALAFYELARCAVELSSPAEAARLLAICTRLTSESGTLDAAFLSRQAEMAARNLPAPEPQAAEIAPFCEMDDVYRLLMQAGADGFDFTGNWLD